MKGRVTGFCLFLLVTVLVGSSWGYTETSVNNFFGTGAGTTNGGSDTFVGAWAGGSNTGSFNSFFGRNAGYGNTTGQGNSFFGVAAGYSYDDVNKVALGTGQDNIFVGYQAGYSYTTGVVNTFVGIGTGYDNTTGRYNSFFGPNAGEGNTTGFWNSAFGYQAGDLNQTGSRNVFIGYKAGYSEPNSNQLYIDNCYYGEADGCKTPLIHGDFFAQTLTVNGQITATNGFVGNGSGLTNINATTVTNGVYTNGSYADAAWITSLAGSKITGTVANATNAGTCVNATNATNASTCTSTAQIGSNTTNYIPRWSGTQLVSGIISDNGSSATVSGTLTVASIVSVSDERYKRNILPLQLSLDKVERLTGVSYEWKTEEYAGKGFKEGKQIGFIAQDVEKVFPELVLTGADGYKAVAYDKLVPVLVEAVKEQHKEMKEKDIQYETSLKDKDARIEKLERALETIERRMATLSPSKTIALK